MTSVSNQDARMYRAALESMSRDAGRVLMSYFRSLDAYEKKGDFDLVTVADKKSEEMVINAITDLFPSHSVLAEESGATGNQEAEYLWIIDPLDGTTNFAHGVPTFSVSIGLQRAGELIAGAVYAPMLNEISLAIRGHGATRNGDSIRVSKAETLKDSMMITGFPYERAEILDWITGTMGKFLLEARGMLRLGSAALDFALVSGGNAEGFYEANLHPWDMAAGVLLVEEAGGKVTRFDGGPFDLFGQQMVASNGLVHDRLVEILSERPLNSA